ncbi:MAG: DUF4212 domain-containing protein [Luminiphilus sp.]|nr:DUF4212 domain-containing protein [Luminiphilus sp.]
MQKLSEAQAKEYWKRNRSLMIRLMAIWFIVSFGFGIIGVDLLNTVQVGGYKLGFWFAQQGSIFVFIGLIFYYVVAMARLDREFGVEED